MKAISLLTLTGTFSRYACFLQTLVFATDLLRSLEQVAKATCSNQAFKERLKGL